MRVPGVSVARGHRNKGPQTGPVKQQELFLSQSGGQRSETKVSAGLAPSGSARAGSFLLLEGPGVPWLVATPLPPLSHAIPSVSVSLCLKSPSPSPSEDNSRWV